MEKRQKNNWKAGVILIVFILSGFQSRCQSDSLFDRRDARDVLRDFFGKDILSTSEQLKRDTSKIYFALVPGFGSNGSDKGFVTSFMSAFFLGDQHTTNLSTVYFTPYFTFSDQIVVPFRTYIWTKNNGFNLIGDYRFMKYPQNQYNMYNYDEHNPDSRLFYYQYRIYQTIARGIAPNLAVGIGIQYDHYIDVHEDKYYNEGITSFKQYGDTLYKTYGSGGPTLELIYDNRRNTINPLRGNYLRGTFRQNVKLFGSNQIWNSIYLDARKYIPIRETKNRVLALWCWYWSILSGKPNYLDLPSIGWDNFGKTGRGIYRNKYRSTSLLYMEAEYRTELSRNGLWGFTAFCNLTMPANMNTNQLQGPYFGVGSGLRLKIDKRSGTKLSLDAGLSKGFWTWYLTLNEFF